MAKAEEYATWIVKNQDKKGTPEFDTVAAAYRAAKLSNSSETKTENTAHAPLKNDVGIMQNIGMGALKALDDIGSTVLGAGAKALDTIGISGPKEAFDRNRADAEYAYSHYANPESYSFKGGRLAGNVATTAPLGGIIAAPLKAAAYGTKFAPAINALATAIESGGFKTGQSGVLANIAARSAGGAISGAASSALTNPDEIVSSALGGAIVPNVVAPIIKPAAKIIGQGIDLAKGNLAKVKAGKIAQEAAGQNINAIKAANEVADQSINAGQAAYGIDQDTYQALVELAKRNDPTSFYRVMSDTQGIEQVNALAKLAQGATQTEAKASQASTQNALNKITTPMRETELNAANIGGDITKKLTPLIAAKEADKIQLLQDSGKMYADTNKTRLALNKKIESKTPGWVKPETIQELSDTYAKNQEATKNLNAMKWQRQDESEFLQRQLQSLDDYGLKPLDSKQIIDSISAKIQSPEIRTSDIKRKVLTNVAKKISEETERGGGFIDANALYEIRKNAVNDEVEKLLRGADLNVQNKRAAQLLQEVRPLIDDAIINAGGTGWKEYLSTHAAGMKQVNQKELLAKALELYKRSPNDFLSLIQGNSPDEIEKIFGKGNFDIVKELGNKIIPLQKIASEVTRDSVIKSQAQAGENALANIIQNNESKFKLPAFLNPKATVTNSLLKQLEQNLNKNVVNELVLGMKSGKSANELLNTLPASDRLKLLKILQNSEAWNPLVGRALTNTGSNALNSLSNEN